MFLDAEHFFDGYRSDPAYALEVVRVATEAEPNVPTVPEAPMTRIVARRQRGRCRCARQRTLWPTAADLARRPADERTSVSVESCSIPGLEKNLLAAVFTTLALKPAG